MTSENDKYEDLGTLIDFCNNFGTCKIHVEDMDSRNIRLVIRSYQDVEFKLLCSSSLSDIIKSKQKLPPEIGKYRILRIRRKLGSQYIRISQSIHIEADPDNPMTEEELNDIPGNVTISYKIEDLIKMKPINPIKKDDIPW
jgi:hypothetical protein